MEEPVYSCAEVACECSAHLCVPCHDLGPAGRRPLERTRRWLLWLIALVNTPGDDDFNCVPCAWEVADWLHHRQPPRNVRGRLAWSRDFDHFESRDEKTNEVVQFCIREPDFLRHFWPGKDRKSPIEKICGDTGEMVISPPEEFEAMLRAPREKLTDALRETARDGLGYGLVVYARRPRKGQAPETHLVNYYVRDSLVLYVDAQEGTVGTEPARASTDGHLYQDFHFYLPLHRAGLQVDRCRGRGPEPGPGPPKRLKTGGSRSC